MIRESQAFARQVKWFTSLVSRGDNLPPLYRLLTEVGAVKVVKKEMARGKSKVALSHGALWTTPNAVVHSNATRRPGCRRPASAAAAGLYRRANPGAIEVLFTWVSRAKRTVHCFSGRVVKLTRSVKAVLLSPTSPANDGSPMIVTADLLLASRSSTAAFSAWLALSRSSWRSTS